MLGVRLGSEVERRLDRFARDHNRAKSEIARAAIVGYLDRYMLDDEFGRQLVANAESERAGEGLPEVEALDVIAWSTVNTLP